MYKTIARAAVLAVTASSLSVAFVTPALAAPEGPRCRFTSITDPTVEGDVQVGQINAGPITGGGDTGDVQITCTIQVNAPFHGAGGTSVASAATPGAAAIPPTQISYVSPEGSIVYMCTNVTVGGQNWYWNSAGGVPESGTWSTSSGGPCSTAISQEIPLPNGEEIDPFICADLAILFPPEGDVPGFWDCPPYGNLDPPGPTLSPDADGVIADAGVAMSGSVLQATDPGAPDDLRDTHDITSVCNFKGTFSQNSVTIQLTGKTTLGKHSGHSQARIRCVLRKGSTVLHDTGTVTQNGSVATVTRTFTTNQWGPYTICVQGGGTWTDGDSVSLALKCKTP